MRKQYIAAVFAILAAALYAVNVPVSKLLLGYVGPAMMAALLYLGAGTGMAAYSLGCRAIGRPAIKEPLTKKELSYTVLMVALDIAAPIFLMIGISKADSANVSLLNNFEIVATSLIALLIFKEAVSARLWAAILMVTAASILLGLDGAAGFKFNTGSLFVLAACVCWGFENNCTKMLSGKSSIQIVVIKGCFSGLGSLIVAFVAGERLPQAQWIAAVMALGFVSYGLSINLYILAQKHLGAAKTSAYYSVAPFLGVGFSLLLLGERPNKLFYPALAIMAAATALMLMDTVSARRASKNEPEDDVE